MTYTKLLLSGSNSGQPILINSITSGSATPIHTAISGTSAFDEIYIYATNNSNATVTTTICWGGTGSANQIPIGIQNGFGRTCVCDGVLLNNGFSVYVYAQTSGSILIDGFVNRIQ